MTVSRGFGIAGAVDHAAAAEIAQAVESAGYATFWANDTPNGEGLASLAAVAAVTSSIRLGVGVIPVDRQPAEAIVRRVAELGLQQDRLLVGIGSGGLTGGARKAVRDAAVELRESLSARIVVGALGPRMCEIAGEFADGVLLNWLTPAYLAVLARITRDAASRAGRPAPWIGAYVRTALAGPALVRLTEEAERYESYPQYAAHFERMGVQAIDTCVSGEASSLNPRLKAFKDADEIVVRAIAAEESLDAYLNLVQAAAPEGSTTS